MKTILITGGAGFIGSNFIEYFLEKYQEYVVVNLDKLTYAGNLDNLASVVDNPRYKFIKGDICDDGLVETIFRDYKISGVIHFAAESHVDNSIKNPKEFILTNIYGSYVLLNTAKNFWTSAPFVYKEEYIGSRFLHVSTDEVYGTLGDEGYFTENTSYAPNSPYSASKASSDMIARSYRHTFGLDTLITNCSNNYGPKQHDEKLIPTIIRNAVNGKPIPIYGKGENVRDWLYVLDHCRAIDLVFHRGVSGETYNVGTRNELKNIDLTYKICSVLDELKPAPSGKKFSDQITFVSDRPGHDLRYAIDPTKIEKELGFKAKHTFEDCLKETVLWYLRKFDISK